MVAAILPSVVTLILTLFGGWLALARLSREAAAARALAEVTRENQRQVAEDAREERRQVAEDAREERRRLAAAAREAALLDVATRAAEAQGATAAAIDAMREQLSAQLSAFRRIEERHARQIEALLSGRRPSSDRPSAESPTPPPEVPPGRTVTETGRHRAVTISAADLATPDDAGRLALIPGGE